MLNQVKTETILTYLIRLIPFFSIAVVVIGLVSLSILFKRIHILVNGQYLAFPIILASLIIICYKPSNLKNRKIIKIPLTISRCNYNLIYLLLYLITIYILIVYQIRPIAYFMLISIMAVVILAEVLTNNYANKPTSILIKIILLAANIIFGHTLKTPLYFGSTDVLPHLHWIETLLVNQHVTHELDSYQYFPLYHIFNAIGQLITNLNLQNAYFVMIGLSFLSSVFFIFLITLKVTNNLNISLVTTLIYSINTEALFAGMNMVTRVMSYIIFLIMFYLLIAKENRDIRKSLLTLSLIVTLVFLHQITLLQEVIILTIFFLLEFFIYHRNRLFNILIPMIFSVSFISYWIYVAGPFFRGILNIIASTTDTTIVPEDVKIVPIYKILLSNAEFSIFAFFAIIGINLLLIKGLEQKEKGKLGVLFALFSFFSMPLFFPGPADYFNHILLSYRIPLMILPFIIIPVVEGIFFFLKTVRNRSSTIPRLAFIFTAVFILALIPNLYLATDLNLEKLFKSSERRYFTKSELYSFDFCMNKTNQSVPIYTDVKSTRYLKDYAARKNTSYSSDAIDNLIKLNNSYFLFRKNHFEERNSLTLISGSTGFAYKYKIYTKDDFYNLDINKKLENNYVQIYDSFDNIVFYKK